VHVSEVVIIGAGIIGSAIALELRSRGVKTLLLEKAVPGAESSSAAAGMLAPQTEAALPDPSFELGLMSRELYPAWVERIQEVSGLEVGYARDGGVRPASSEAELDRALAQLAWQKERGLRIERLDREATHRLVPGIHAACAGALYFPDEAQVDPRLLMRALALATARVGVEHLSATTVRRIRTRGDRLEAIELSDRTVACERAVIAAGAWSSTIEGADLPKDAVQPARGQMLALDAGRPPFRPYVFAQKGYLVPRKDGRVLVGATVELAGYDKAVTAGGLADLLSAALETVPALRSARVVETWSGLRPWTPDHLPILGRTSIEGLHLATGHYRNGILQAPATAALIADQICGTTPSLDLAAFSVERFRS
jgi:glycine oxidase